MWLRPGETSPTTNGFCLPRITYLSKSFALIQRKLGLGALQGFADAFVPLLQPVWVDEALHAAAVASLFTAAQRHLSLVDCISFELMRRLGLTDVLALDADFTRQGFNLLPAEQA